MPGCGVLNLGFVRENSIEILNRLSRNLSVGCPGNRNSRKDRYHRRMKIMKMPGECRYSRVGVRI